MVLVAKNYCEFVLMCINRHFFSSFYVSKAKTYYLHLMGCPVSLYVYDLSKGLARLCSHGFLGNLPVTAFMN